MNIINVNDLNEALSIEPCHLNICIIDDAGKLYRIYSIRQQGSDLNIRIGEASTGNHHETSRFNPELVG